MRSELQLHLLSASSRCSTSQGTVFAIKKFLGYYETIATFD